MQGASKEDGRSGLAIRQGILHGRGGASRADATNDVRSQKGPNFCLTLNRFEKLRSSTCRAHLPMCWAKRGPLASLSCNRQEKRKSSDPACKYIYLRISFRILTGTGPHLRSSPYQPWSCPPSSIGKLHDGSRSTWFPQVSVSFHQQLASEEAGPSELSRPAGVAPEAEQPTPASSSN